MSSSPQPLVVVVEDEEHLLKLVTLRLEEAGMQVQGYTSAAPALRFLRANFANLLLLDINLPGGQSGFDLRDALNRDGLRVPTIFLTGNTLEASKVHGLELGGDDYVTKPFSYAELVARIHAVLRRASGRTDLHVTENATVGDTPFDFCGAHVIPARLEIQFPDGQVGKIGRKELGIVAHLNARRGAVIPRKALIHAVWGAHANVTSRSLDQYVVKVRGLFRRHGLELVGFRTVHGVGYLFDPEGIAKESS
jgi:DNA-binding response OmpR family regulator